MRFALEDKTNAHKGLLPLGRTGAPSHYARRLCLDLLERSRPPSRSGFWVVSFVL